MKPEAAYRQAVIAELKKAKQDPLAVENGDTVPGTPDVNCLLGWIELKACPAWPKREMTPLRIDHFTQQQRNFLRRRWNRGGGAWLLIRVGTHREIENLLFAGPDAHDHVGHVDRAELDALSVMHTRGKIKGSDLVKCMERSLGND